MSEWRYAVEHDTVNNHTTITRGRIYKASDPDTWSSYWDGDWAAGFYDEGFRGLRIIEGSVEYQSEQAIAAYRSDREGVTGALDMLAQTLTGFEESRFIYVPLDRGIDLYALSPFGDPDNVWRDEIEEVWNGEVYRIETEMYYLMSVDADGEHWQWMPADDVYDEWYGLDNAETALAQAFPETEFPAEKVIPDTGE